MDRKQGCMLRGMQQIAQGLSRVNRTLVRDLMTVVIKQQLQAARHAAADARDEFEVKLRPLLSDDRLHLLHCLREASVDARLEYVPHVLDGVEIRAPG